MEYYVYVYKDPRTGAPFYVGKGKGKRCFNHLNWKQTFKRVRDKISSITSIGLHPTIEIVRDHLSEAEAYTYEENLITLYGRRGIEPAGILMNICLGSRPPTYRNKDIISSIYASDSQPVNITDTLVLSVLTFLEEFEGLKKFNNLLKTDVGRDFILATKHFPVEYTVPQRIYHIQHNLSNEPVCEHCGGKVSFKCYLGESTTKQPYQYATFCSTTCRNKSEWSREIGRNRIYTTEALDKKREISKRLHKQGIIGNTFKFNNPMKTKEGRAKWKASRAVNTKKDC